MRQSEIRRTMSLFPIGIVMQLTELTARQIRYYEDHKLITPERTQGNRRLFSLNDIDRLLEIRDLLEQGLNMAGIKRLIGLQVKEFHHDETNAPSPLKKEISDEEMRKLLRSEVLNVGRFRKNQERFGNSFRNIH
jgi:MerR family glutamine synthetase transcriptional repressor